VGENQKSTIFLVVNWVSYCCDPLSLSLFLSASTDATYIFTAPTCTSTIITLETCASTAELQRFIPRFILKIPYFAYLTQRGDRGERRPKDRVKTGWLYGKLWWINEFFYSKQYAKELTMTRVQSLGSSLNWGHQKLAVDCSNGAPSSPSMHSRSIPVTEGFAFCWKCQTPLLSHFI
jgi:hypothetical protein